MSIMYPGSHSQLDLPYKISENKVYWGNNEIVGADVDSFIIYSNVWASDKNNVYTEWRPRRVDKESFTFINPVFVKDKKYVYDYHGAIQNADPLTFECLDSGLQSLPWKIVNYVWARGYGKDKNYVYYHDQMTGNATPLKQADNKTFMSYGNGFGRDQNSVFYEKYKLNGANPNRWLHLGKCYSTDQKKTFHRNRELKGVNPGKFRVMLTETYGEFATDGNLYFKNDREITKNEFIASIESDIERIKNSHEHFFNHHCK